MRPPGRKRGDYPGAVRSLAMPDAYGDYGLPIGGVAAIRLDDTDAAVCPSVGFDINCGVRLIRTDLTRQDVERKQARLADLLRAAVPASVGTVSPYTPTMEDLDDLLARWRTRWSRMAARCRRTSLSARRRAVPDRGPGAPDARGEGPREEQARGAGRCGRLRRGGCRCCA